MGFQKISIFTGNPETNINYRLRPHANRLMKKVVFKHTLRLETSLVMHNTLIA